MRVSFLASVLLLAASAAALRLPETGIARRQALALGAALCLYHALAALTAPPPAPLLPPAPFVNAFDILWESIRTTFSNPAHWFSCPEPEPLELAAPPADSALSCLAAAAVCAGVYLLPEEAPLGPRAAKSFAAVEPLTVVGVASALYAVGLL